MRRPIKHELKTWPDLFEASAFPNIIKPWELRVNDRDFQVGDFLMLREWDPSTEEYTGRNAGGLITYILHGGQLGLPENMVIMSYVPEPVLPSYIP